MTTVANGNLTKEAAREPSVSIKQMTVAPSGALDRDWPQWQGNCTLGYTLPASIERTQRERSEWPLTLVTP